MKKLITIGLMQIIGLSSGAFALENDFIACKNIQTASKQVNLENDFIACKNIQTASRQES